MPPGLIDLPELLDRVRKELLAILRTKSSRNASEKYLGPTGKESVYDSVMDNLNLPPQEWSLLRLEQERALLVMAGTESPAKSLNKYLWKCVEDFESSPDPEDDVTTPDLAKTHVGAHRGRSQIRSRSTSRTPKRAASVDVARPYALGRSFFAVISATSRAKFNRLVAGDDDDTDIEAPELDEDENFDDDQSSGDEHLENFVLSSFDPERWLGSEGRERRKFQTAFGKGGRKCLGIELARAQFYLVTAALVRAFDMTLWETDESDVAFVHDYQVSLPKFESKGVRLMMKAI
ncbi:hypothetical protein V1506DRAFT_504995 [Lipomyces tetrasporus]